MKKLVKQPLLNQDMLRKVCFGRELAFLKKVMHWIYDEACKDN